MSHYKLKFNGMLPPDAALRHYLDGIFDVSTGKPFVTFYDFKEKSTIERSFSRESFFELVTKAISLLRQYRASFGDRQTHYMSGNSVEDLILRTASLFTCTVPVTVNWQSDNISQVHYKIEATASRIVFFDDRTPGVQGLRDSFPHVSFVNVKEIYSIDSVSEVELLELVSTHSARLHDARCVIFTSGTTGHPKGVELSYANYLNNRKTFETFLELENAEISFCPLVVNPLHHTNSTSITDWALRRPNTHLHLVERYSTPFWQIAAAVSFGLDCAQVLLMTPTTALEHQQRTVNEKRVVLIPLVSRHIDFLESLVESACTQGGASLGVDATVLKLALSQSILLLGSAPVGPTTTERLLKYADRLPTVRFGSTETTLQVCGIPISLSREQVMAAFRKGWEHRYSRSPSRDGEEEGEPCQGFYIGRHHKPYTEVAVVKSVSPTDPAYLQRCEEGEPGYLITRGGHIMKGYVSQPALTAAVITPEEGWYINLGDVGFYLNNEGEHDLYWQSRDSHMLIRGGANYAFEQVSAELVAFVESHFSVPRSVFSLAVCGLRVQSEHEDECCVMMELLEPYWQRDSSSSEDGEGEESASKKARTEQDAEEMPNFTITKRLDIENNFLKAAGAKVSKGAKPDRFRIGKIPMILSKGVVNIPALVAMWKEIAANDRGNGAPKI